MTTKNVLKKLTYKAVSKCQVKHLTKWKILAGILFVLFLFCMELAGKKLMRTYTYILTPPLVRTSTRLAGPYTPL